MERDLGARLPPLTNYAWDYHPANYIHTACIKLGDTADHDIFPRKAIEEAELRYWEQVLAGDFLRQRWTWSWGHSSSYRRLFPEEEIRRMPEERRRRENEATGIE